MSAPLQADLCVIGGGSGGLTVAAGAAQMGAKTILIEGHKMGGDCLNYGCVPSKSLIAAASTAATMRHAQKFGIQSHEPDVDFAEVNAHIHGVIGAIAPHDSIERFEGLGVQVLTGNARFSGPHEIVVGSQQVRARRFVIATGSRAAVPPIPGLDETPHLTNETIFDLRERPDHLIVIGGGPIGTELAQAHRRLGSKVTLLEGMTILNKDDPDAVDIVRRRLKAEGIEVQENAQVSVVAQRGGRVEVTVGVYPDHKIIEGSHLLVAVGRTPNVENLDLPAAAIRFSRKGIEVDRRLRTSNKRVFAIGDVTGGLQFTHLAAYHAGIVIRNALFRWPAKANYDAVPWVTYADPELAHVGLTEAVAKEQLGKQVNTTSWHFNDNDRAQAERDTDGLIKVVTGRKGRILGATVVGRHAGELILPWVLALQQKLGIGAMANLIAPYPTLSEVSKRVAGAYYSPKLFNGRTRSVVGLLQRVA